MQLRTGHSQITGAAEHPPVGYARSGQGDNLDKPQGQWIRRQLRRGRFPALLLFFSVLFVVSVEESAAPRLQELKPGAGREVVAERCLSCHDATLITTPRLTRSQWDRLVTAMVDEQGMEALSPEVRRTILEYLVETQSPDP